MIDHVTYGDPIVFGTRLDTIPLPKIENLPTDTRSVKIRMRIDQLTIAYVKTSNAVAAYHMTELCHGGNWRLLEYPIGANITKKL